MQKWLRRRPYRRRRMRFARMGAGHRRLSAIKGKPLLIARVKG